MSDVASPVDFPDIEHARAWVASTAATKPWRPHFFRTFAGALTERFDRPFTILEVGSGTGHLAAEVLGSCPIATYVAVDFSEAMHRLAKDHLGLAADRVEFKTLDFRSADWIAHLGRFEAVVTMQAAHEVRHKRHLPTLLRQIRDLTDDDGLLLFCDHYAEPASNKNSELFLTREEQPEALAHAGFRDIRLLLDCGGMALYRCHPRPN